MPYTFTTNTQKTSADLIVGARSAVCPVSAAAGAHAALCDEQFTNGYYIEYLVSVTAGGLTGVGAVDYDAVFGNKHPNSYMKDITFCWVYYSSGAVYRNNVLDGTYATYTNGDRIGLYWASGNTVKFYKNGVLITSFVKSTITTLLPKVDFQRDAVIEQDIRFFPDIYGIQYLPAGASALIGYPHPDFSRRPLETTKKYISIHHLGL